MQDRPTPQPGDIWQHWQGKKYRILSVDDGRVEYKLFNSLSLVPFTTNVSLDYFLGVSLVKGVNRFEFVEGDRV